MKGSIKNLLLFIGIVIIVFLPIIINYYNNKKVKILTYDEYKELLTKDDFALVYFGNTKSNDYSSVKKILINTRNKYDNKVYAVNKAELTSKQKAELVSSNADFSDQVYVYIKEKTVKRVMIASKINENTIMAYVNYYVNDVIPEADIAYKTVSTYDEYMKVISSKKIIMTVFGRNTCHWCNKFKPVYNEVAKENNLDIYFIDSDSFNADEYKKIMNSSLMIPAACTDDGKEKALSSGFGTPLTLFTKKGKVTGCINGYVAKNGLLTKLKEVGMLK